MSWLPLAGIKVADFSALIAGPFVHDDVERILRSAAARGATGVRGAAGVKE